VPTYALAVLAACANGLSSVLQGKANREAPQRENLSPRSPDEDDDDRHAPAPATAGEPA
jgi:hypothetical protein